MNMPHETPPPLPENSDVPQSPDFIVPPEGQVPLGGYTSVETQTAGPTPLSEIIARNRQPGSSTESHEVLNGNTSATGADSDTTESPRLDLKSELGIQVGIYKELGALARFGLEKASDKAATKIGELSEKRQARKEAGVESRSERVGKLAKKIGKVAARKTVVTSKKAKAVIAEKRQERAEAKNEAKEYKRELREAKAARKQEKAESKPAKKEAKKDKKSKQKQGKTYWKRDLKKPYVADPNPTYTNTTYLEQISQRESFVTNEQNISRALFDLALNEADPSTVDEDSEKMSKLLANERFVIVMADLKERVDAIANPTVDSVNGLVRDLITSAFYGRYGIDKLNLLEPESLSLVLKLMHSSKQDFDAILPPDYVQKKATIFNGKRAFKKDFDKDDIRRKVKSRGFPISDEDLAEIDEIIPLDEEGGDNEGGDNSPVSFAGKKVTRPQSPPPYIPQPSNTESSDQEDSSETNQGPTTPPPFDMSKLSGPLLKDEGLDESATEEPEDKDEDSDSAPSTAGNPEFDDSANNAAYFAAQRLREQNQSRRRGGRRY